MAFLDKANRDPSEGYNDNNAKSSQTASASGGPFKTTSEGVEVPPPLVKVTRDAFYTSDADEPFEAVALRWDEDGKGLPDEGMFFLSFLLASSNTVAVSLVFTTLPVYLLAYSPSVSQYGCRGALVVISLRRSFGLGWASLNGWNTTLIHVAEEFASLIGHWAPSEAEIEILDPVDWDSNGQYADMIDAVREAGAGNDIRVYRVGREGVKAEYWIVTTEGKGKGAKLVGVKALAVES